MDSPPVPVRCCPFLVGLGCLIKEGKRNAIVISVIQLDIAEKCV